MNKDLRLAVKREYFEAIASGEKLEEYRLNCDYWNKRLIKEFGGENVHYDTLTITLGYPKKDDKSKTMTFKYKGFKEKTITHKHFGESAVPVFAIDLSERINNG